MATNDEEQERLRSVALQNAQSILLARRRAEEALRKQSEWLQVTLASIGDAVISTDAESRISFMNRVAEVLTGWSQTEALGRPLPDVFHILNEQSGQPVENPALRALREGTIVGLANHTILVAKDGTERPIDDSAAPIRDGAGMVAGAVLVFRDITDRKRQDLADAERNRLVALRADISTALVSAQTTPTALQHCCEALVRHLDVAIARIWTCNGSGGALELQASAGLATRLDGPQGRIPLGQSEVGRIAASREPHLTNAIDDDPQISERDWAEREGMQAFAGYPLVVEERVVGVLAMFARHAISAGILTEFAPLAESIAQYIDRRRAEARERRLLAEAAAANAKFRAFFEQGALFAGLLEVDGTVIEPNRLALDGCGYTREEVVGKPFWECPWWNRSPELMERIKTASVQAAAGLTFRAEMPYFVADGCERVVDIIILPIKDEAGRVMFLAPTGTDITERRRLEQELRRVAADLSAADHRKNEFLAMLAHELRNPLAPIRNALRVVQLSAGNGQAVQSATEMMERQISHMVRLVDDLLDVSRITSGKIDLRRERAELASIIQQAIETSRPAIERAGHELTVTLPPQPVHLSADPMRLAQVISNLLNNSCKYSEPGGQISLTAERQGSDVVVSVKDAGVGIPREMLPRIFELFTQVDQSLERSEGGLGIGLSLVKSLVELHGGSVMARSEGPGRGSEFVVRLPVLIEPSKPLAAPAIRKPTLATGRRILIVDDNRDSALSLAMLLKMTGNETQTVYDGLAAVEAAAAFRPDVILLDIGLPKLNGYEAARQIRGQPWGEKMMLVALTGWGQDEDRQKSKAAGFDSHMVKPVEYAALKKLLAELPVAT